jgi:hypothetical protein
MASTIKIKRSGSTPIPSGGLAAGELAYSWNSNRLYIGTGTETDGIAANIDVIGGKEFTDRLDHTPGTLTASSAIIVDANSKIDNLLVDNLQLNGNTLSTTDTDGDLLISPNGVGKTIISNLYIGDGNTSIQEYIQDVTGSLVAGEGIDIVYDDNAGTTTISAELATSSNPGVASFDPTDFSVSLAGNVTLNAESIQDIVGGMVSSNTESGISVTYDDGNGKLNFNVNDPTITIAGDVDGSATMTDLGDTTINVTLDTVNSNVGSFGSSTSIPVITVDGKGRVTAVSTQSISSSFTLAGDTGTDTFNNGETLTFVGTDPIDTAVTNNTVTISIKDASTTVKGAASFNSASFDVASGAVSIKSGGVSNSQLANSSVTFGSTTVSLGSTSTSLAGITELTVDNLNINGNEIQSTNGNGDIILNPNGTGRIDVSAARIINVAEPVDATDAATKNYVDNAVSGLTWKDSAHLLADTNVALTGSTNTLVIDGHAALDQTDDGYRLLLLGQTNQAENGIYLYTDNGTTYTLVRTTDADTYQEIIGASIFIKEGTVYANTGWTQSNHYLVNFGQVGNYQNWVQFSGAGAYTAGAGLGQSGNEFFAKVATSGGIEIVDDSLQLKSTLAGNGLTYTNGVLTVGGTADRISVGVDAIDIASTYVGQTSITTLGTIATGTWNATTIATNKGGTGLTSYTTGDLLYASATDVLSKLAAGVEGTVLQMNSAGVPVWGNIDGGTY